MTDTLKAAAEKMIHEFAAHAHAPYSGFRVGAVLEDIEGNLHAGCNLESASIGLSLCAERAALAAAWATGARAFRRLWVYTPTAEPTRPCGACREMLLRCGRDMEVILLCDGKRAQRTRLARLLPGSEPSNRRRA